MTGLTGVERIGLYEHFWGDTLQVWQKEGHIRENEDLALHFGFDLSTCWPFNLVARLDFVPEVLEETEETILTRDGNGAVLRRHKLHSSTPEHVDFEVKAGMDPLRIKRAFGDRLSLCGGMDARNLVANDLDAIRRELQEKIPVLRQNYGYILHSDHSIPTATTYQTYRFFVDEGLRLGTF